MSQYFENEELISNRKTIREMIGTYAFSFVTDNGVFSKNHVDEYSKILLSTLTINEERVESALDMGCGYGVLGFYIKKHYNCSVDMVDVNHRALDLAIENGKLNNLECNIYKSDIFSAVKGKYSLIITNPPIHAGKETCFNIYKDAVNHLSENGCLYLVIAKKHGYKSTIEYLENLYSRCIVLHKKKGIFVIKCNK